jgi:(2Fe-2S) ferredoxin
MKEHSASFLRLVFVCCQDREGGPNACSVRGQENLIALRAAFDRSDAEVEVVACGCLGFCSIQEGVVLDPFGRRVWTGVRAQDAKTLVQKMEGPSSKEVE